MKKKIIKNEDNEKLQALKYMVSTKGWKIFLQELDNLQKKLENDIIYGSEIDVNVLRAEHKAITTIKNRIYQIIDELESGMIGTIDFSIYE